MRNINMIFTVVMELSVRHRRFLARRLVASAALLLFLDGGVVDADPAKLYWSDGQGVWCANLDGTAPERLKEDWHVGAIAVDGRQQKVYWSWRPLLGGAGGIRRADLDGRNVEDVALPLRRNIPLIESPCAIAIDLLDAKLYVVALPVFEINRRLGLWRASLDGGDLQRLLRRTATCTLVVDQRMRKIHLPGQGAVLTLDLDRAASDPSLGELVVPRELDGLAPLLFVLDTAHRNVYWVRAESLCSGRVRERLCDWLVSIVRADMAGGNGEVVVPEQPQQISALAVAPARGLLFWAQEDGLYRSALDGSAPMQIVPIETGARVRDMAIWTPPGDLDGDEDVDLADLMAMASCFSGPGEALPDDPICVEADLDFDGDVDLADLVEFQSHFTGAR